MSFPVGSLEKFEQLPEFKILLYKIGIFGL
uniref:Uncharacterized protein n=1 Tax=Arundo donax TaxID=35708 RepID=A0A0A9H3U4_ARUDO